MEDSAEATVYRSKPLTLLTTRYGDRGSQLVLMAEEGAPFLYVDLPGYVTESTRFGDKLRITVTRADEDS